MSLSCSDVCEAIDQKLRALGFDYPDDEDHEPIFEAFGQCILQRRDDAVLYAVTERQLAIAWTEARCLDCQAGACELDGSGHDLSVYYGLPKEHKQELRGRVTTALMSGTVTEAVHDVLASVAERP